MIIVLTKTSDRDTAILTKLFQYAAMKIQLANQNYMIQEKIEDSLIRFMAWSDEERSKHSTFEIKEWSEDLMYEYEMGPVLVKGINGSVTEKYDYPDWLITGVDTVDKIESIKERTQCLVFRVRSHIEDATTILALGMCGVIQMQHSSNDAYTSDFLKYPVNYTIALRLNIVLSLLEIERLMLHYRSIIS